ncbi:hypothetical protein SI65_09960 [Aspergillus cristatus]|uniref:Uncharacterized protein n=1 Tax=Aspergillus cristatus TaxID=573508 RepID=A0A1E3B114_ASPCR|nr:hypothetical protein SI65_09960 [Aspergillus cristatus]
MAAMTKESGQNPLSRAREWFQTGKGFGMRDWEGEEEADRAQLEEMYRHNDGLLNDTLPQSSSLRQVQNSHDRHISHPEP